MHFDTRARKVPRLPPDPSPARITLFMPSLTGGGVERMQLHLAEAFAARGHEVDLVLTRVRGEHDRRIPERLAPIRLRRASAFAARRAAARAAGRQWPELLQPVLGALSASWAVRYLPALAEYLAERQPDVLLSANSWPNLVALWARRLSGAPTRIVVSERVQLSARVAHLGRHARWRHLPRLIARSYPEAAGIVAISEGVARDLAATTGLPRESIATLPNPVVSARLGELAAAPCPHEWLAEGAPPVILGAGRLHPQKDFATLLSAFARIRAAREARLIILGEGAERPHLESLAHELGVAGDVALPGYVDNPFAFMSRAAVFALSSRYEGFGNVLLEALACGCPAVSTDCPSGPGEILEGGRVGPLVPVGDAAALAQAILTSLDAPPPRAALARAAAPYSVEAATRAYLDVLLGGGPGPCAAP